MADIDALIEKRREEMRNHELYKLMKSGSINPETYAWLLWQCRWRYERLEDYAEELGIFDEFPELRRYDRIRDDFEEIWKKQLGNKRPPHIAAEPATDFMKHIKELFEDEEQDNMQILAYMYVLHVGDIVAGKDLLGKVPGSGKIMQFDGDVEELRTKVKNKLKTSKTDMSDELEECFRLMKNLYDRVWNDPKLPKF